jgi:tRNA (guanine37-N1)-methyltransferase
VKLAGNKMDRNLKQSLAGKLTKSEIKILPRAFEVIGSIAIIEIPAGLKKREKLIAESILKLHKNVKTVVKKAGKFSGRLRLRATKLLAGINTRETLYRENGCTMKLDIDKCYFSSRMSSDRLDIAKQVKKGEKVLVMFGGIAPYAVVISKYSKAAEIISVEINRIASEYAKKNVSLNKLGNVEIIQGDVKRIIPLLKKKKMKFDRIVMTRPQLKNTFLHEAFMVAKKGTIIHMHDFSDEKNMPDESFSRIFDAAAKDKVKYQILQWKKIGDVAPHRYRLRIDFRIL